MLHSSLTGVLVNRWLMGSLFVQVFIFIFSIYWGTHHLRKKKAVLRALSAFNGGQEQIYELGELARYIVKFFAGELGSRTGALFLYSRQRNELRISGWYGIENPHDFPPLVTGNVAAWTLQISLPAVPVKECATPFFEDAFPSLRERLEKEGFSFLIPLIERGFLLGLVAVGGTLKAGSHDVLEPLSSAAARAVESLYLYESSVTDETTGLYNKRFFHQTLQAELRRADRYNQPCGLLAFDIDDFKKINDTYGHPQGDRVLKELAACMQECLREGIDIAARTGGEEFHVILPATDAERAFKVGERIGEAVRQREFSGFKEKHKVTVSLGTATYPFHASSEGELIGVADKALYLAKAKGKDRICSASELESEGDTRHEVKPPGAGLNIMDPGTGLFNPEYFSIRLKEELKRAVRYQSHCSLVIFGFEGDERGSAFEAIRRFSPFLRESLRLGIDTPSALDRQHVGIIIPETEKEKAGIMAQRVTRLAKGETISAGVAGFPEDALTEEALMTKAFLALEEAQKEGGNQCVLWQE